MAKQTYEENLDLYPTDTIFTTIRDDLTTREQKEVDKQIMNFSQVSNLISTSLTFALVKDMMTFLNSVIFILIIPSAILAFVIMYNLPNINISERHLQNILKKIEYSILGDEMKKMYPLLTVLALTLAVIPVKILAQEVDLTPNATSAIMLESSTGEIIYEKNAYEELPPASMTKMMTMLLIMERIENKTLKLTDKVTASQYASSMGGSQIFLEPGEEMSVEDLLKGIAIGSGNDVVVTKKQSQVIEKNNITTLNPYI